MKLQYEAKGEARKELVQAIEGFTGSKAEYLRMPSCAYRIEAFTVDKEGNVVVDDSLDSEIRQGLMDALTKAGFTLGSDDAPFDWVISLPIERFTTNTLENLRRLLEAKGELIQKALLVDALPIETDEQTVSFPWFKTVPDAESIRAYTNLIVKLCDQAAKQTRVTAKPKESENDKYAFRCFLLRLGFIGDTYKADRKILLQHLTGSSAFKHGTPEQEELLDA